MRTYKDAKAMAKSLRESLAARSVALSHSASLEVVAKQLGFADWNTLSAKLAAEPKPEPGHRAAGADHPSVVMPAEPGSNEHTPRFDEHEQMFCSFCDKSQRDVRSLIEGGCRNPVISQCVFICDECVAFSAQVLAERLSSPS